jgi:hypothetical protein
LCRPDDEITQLQKKLKAISKLNFPKRSRLKNQIAHLQKTKNQWEKVTSDMLVTGNFSPSQFSNVEKIYTKLIELGFIKYERKVGHGQFGVLREYYSPTQDGQMLWEEFLTEGSANQPFELP